MPREFIPPPGASYPATAADLRKWKAGEREKVRTVSPEPGKPIAAPYPEIVASWVANGWEEVKDDGISER